MLKIDGWLFATLIFHAHIFICNITYSSSSNSTTNSTSTTKQTINPSTIADTIGSSTLCTTAGTTNTASTTTEHKIIGIGTIAGVAVVVLVAACYYRRRRSPSTGTKARKDDRFSDKTNGRESVRTTDNPNVRPSLECDNQMSIIVHSDANAVYASVQKMRPSQREIARSACDNMINTMERVPDNTYNHKTELLDDTYDSTITCGKITLDETYDHTNFKTNPYGTYDTYDNTNFTHGNIYDPDSQQAKNEFEPTYEYTRNNADGETSNKPFQAPIENVDQIYNNM